MIKIADLELWKEYVKGVNPKGTPSGRTTKRNQHIRTNPRSSVPTLDLHGMTVHDAFLSFTAFIQKAHFNESKQVVIITGRSGQIRREFLGWLDNRKIHVLVREVTKKNEGSFLLKLRKSKD
jgi:DNA-nicking Smr family endonuclease